MSRKKNNYLIGIWYFIVTMAVVVMAVNLPSQDWLLNILKLGAKLTLITLLASYVGNLIEERNWTRFMHSLTRPLIHWGRLPSVSASAILSSFFSLITANSMLASAYKEKTISRSQMYVTAICTSFMSYVYHSLRIMYPTIAAIGLAAGLYFGLLFAGGAIVVLLALIYSRSTQSSGVSVNDVDDQKVTQVSFRQSGINALKKTRTVAYRMIVIALPLLVFFSFLAEIGAFEISDSTLQRFRLADVFPSQIVAVATSMMGGLVSAAAVAAGFIKNGELTHLQVLLALLSGNLIALPIRSIRRSLPSAMSVFEARDAVYIVLLNQGTRFLTNLILVLVLIGVLV